MIETFKRAKPSVRRFAREARQCANEDLGFAAMLSPFPLVLSLAEAIAKTNNTGMNEGSLFSFIVERMPDPSGWMLKPKGGDFTTGTIALKLRTVRDGLTHQMSVPEDVILATTRRRANILARAKPSKYIIITTHFVAAARNTALRLIEEYPEVRFDPWSENWSRGAANRTTLQGPDGSINSSGSMAISNEEIHSPRGI